MVNPMRNAPRKTMRLRCLQHVPFEGPEEIARWARERGHALGITRLFRDEPLPAAEEFDWLIVMGGPMSVHDERLYPWLAGEKSLIARCLQEWRFVFGVCLGSQLLAECLGASVYRNAVKEIGWLPVRLRTDVAAGSLLEGLSAELTVLQWHGETYDLPKGCLHLAESEGCAVQAFEHPTALGLQFHLETTRSGLRQLIRHCREDIGTGPFEQPVNAILAGEATHGATARGAVFQVLDRIAARIASHRNLAFGRLE